MSRQYEEERQILIDARIQQAEQAFHAGLLLLQQNFYADAVNRFYYSMFYAVLALLITRNLGTSKHIGAISLFDREFVKPGIFSKDLSKALHDAFEERLEADYTDLAIVSEETAQQSKHYAQIFLQQIKAYLADVFSEEIDD